MCSCGISSEPAVFVISAESTLYSLSRVQVNDKMLLFTAKILILPFAYSTVPNQYGTLVPYVHSMVYPKQLPYGSVLCERSFFLFLFFFTKMRKKYIKNLFHTKRPYRTVLRKYDSTIETDTRVRNYRTVPYSTRKLARYFSVPYRTVSYDFVCSLAFKTNFESY